jgi:hypothetical protein
MFTFIILAHTLLPVDAPMNSHAIARTSTPESKSVSIGKKKTKKKIPPKQKPVFHEAKTWCFSWQKPATHNCRNGSDSGG